MYARVGLEVVKNPGVIKPHVKVPNIAKINFEKMKDMGMEKLIFDK